jgi:hypothetical protein
MVSTCANPDCAAPFRYLREGRLFGLWIDAEGTIHAAIRGQGRLELFWLCSRCSTTFTLAVDSGKGIVCVPRLDLPGGMPLPHPLRPLQLTSPCR